ncbi:hypothetical protein [Actinoplanes sp. NPDC049265]|uniref:hypothetical protein n=1 Tax=Actinoplanes sp. NPDC049265 TaxID=3363902 RepID=UPI0037124E3B
MTPDPRFEREARRRALLDRVLRDPGDAEARERLAEHVVAAGRRPAYPGSVGFLAAVGVVCAVVALVALLAGLDVTAALLAVAGIYIVIMIRRRRS